MADEGRDPGVRRVLLLAGVLGAVAFAAMVAQRAVDAPLAGTVPVLALAVAFALVESFPVHIELRREAHSISLSAIPLLVGTFTLGLTPLVAARLAGSAVALVGVRKQRSFKLWLNLAVHAVETVVSFSVLHALLGPDPEAVRAWGAALAATVATDVVGATLVHVAIALYQGRFERGDLGWLGLSPVTVASSFADTSVALVAITLLDHEPLALIPFSVLAALLGLAYHAYVQLQERHKALELVHDFTEETAKALRQGSMLEVLAKLTREHMHAERAWVYIGAPGEGGRRVEVDEHGTLHTDVEAAAGTSSLALALAVREGGSALVIGAGSSLDLGPHHQLMVAPLQGQASAIGALVVADRSGNVRPFGKTDARLFETLARHAGVALDADQLIIRLRKEVELNEFQSRHDMLTGLANRRLFSEALDRALAADEPVAVLAADLDGFKDVNDTLGHQNGDQLLCLVAARMTSALRSDDVVARLGGDEFAILLRDARSVAAARAAAVGLRSALEQPVELEGAPLVVGASIGVAFSEGEVGADELMRRADVAMYRAKGEHLGVEVYAPERDGFNPDHLAMVNELRSAIETGTLDVWFQPQVDLATGRVLAAEALVRWWNPRLGFVPPDQFVTVAERTGLIRGLTLLVLDRAMEQCARWRRDGWDLHVSINLSARDLLDPELLGVIDTCMGRHGLPAHALCLELTETGVMSDERRAEEILHAIAGRGITLAIDDFGTGYSSLSRLRDMPVEEIKIDRSFVSQLLGAHQDEVIVRTIGDLGRNLGMRIVAEGVEDESTRVRLEQMGVDVGQGYLWSKPLDAESFATWLAAQPRTVPQSAAHPALRDAGARDRVHLAS